MGLKAEKIDKKFINDIFNYYDYHEEDKKKKYNKRPWAPKISFSGKGDSEWFEVKLDYERGYYDAGISADDIRRIEEKYQFCSLSCTQTGTYLILRRSRWNECDDCGVKLWITFRDKDGYFLHHNINDMKFFNIAKYKRVCVCEKCYKKRVKGNKKRQERL